MIKRVKSIVAMVLAVVMCLPAIVATAAESPTSKGHQVSVEIVNYEDGTSSVERIYTTHNPNSRATFGTDTYTKEKEWHTGLAGNGSVMIKCSVTASFDWDSTTKKVTVYDEAGEVIEVAGGEITESITTSGNNTSKAKATFTAKRKIWSGTKSYPVTVSCTYKGKPGT